VIDRGVLKQISIQTFTDNLESQGLFCKLRYHNKGNKGAINTWKFHISPSLVFMVYQSATANYGKV